MSTPYALGWDPALERPARAAWEASGSPPRYSASIFAADPTPRPAGFSLTDLLYWWFDQGNLGSCAPNSATQVVQVSTAYAARRLGLPISDVVMLSRRFTWYLGRQLDGLLGRGAGQSVTNSLRAFHEFGCPPDPLWPYKDDHRWCETKPPADVVAAAKPFGLKGLVDLEFGDEDGIEAAIFNGTPPNFGIWWPFGWDQGQIDQYGRTTGIGGGVFGHALGLYGYVRPGVWDRYRWWQVVNTHGPIYPLPSPEMRAKVVGYRPARADRCYSFWVRHDLLQRVASYGNAELVAPIGPYAPDPRGGLSWSDAG